MTSTDKAPHEIAAELEERLFRLYDRAGRPIVTWTSRGPNIVWTHDGLRVSRAVDREGDPALAAAIGSAELRLETFLRQYRSQLGAIPRWRPYYADHALAHDDGMPAVQDGFRYNVHLHAPGLSWRVPDIAYGARTLTEACARTLDHLRDNRSSTLAGGILVLDVTDRLDVSTPRLYLAETLPTLIDKLDTFAREHTTALALRLAVQHRQLNVPPAWKDPTAPTLTQAVAGHGMNPAGTSASMPVEYLAARWAAVEAVAETQRTTEPNRWKPHLDKASIDLNRVRAEVRRIDDIELATQAQHPEARYRDMLLRSFVTYYTDRPTSGEISQHAQIGIDRHPGSEVLMTETIAAESIRSLIGTAHPYPGGTGQAPFAEPESYTYFGEPEVSPVSGLEA